MAASVLNSERAVEIRKLNELERKLGVHDQAIISLVAAIKELMKPETKEKATDRI